jgi:hypothetical protein
MATGAEGDRRLRFETLLYGGDEYVFVLPAWAGWAFMDQLQKRIATFTAPTSGAEEPVTYAAGMVFAHYKSTIRELRRAAEDLCNAAKDLNRASDEERNVVQVTALEGIDRAAIDIGTLRRELLGLDVAAAAFTLDGARWSDLTDAMERAGRRIGRHQLHHLYRLAEDERRLAARANEPWDEAAWRDGAIRRLNEFPQGADLATPLFADDLLAAGTASAPFLPLYHVLTLADYVEASRR